MMKEFRQFIFRGNVVDLAVAVVIGAAFGAVVTSLTANVLTPLIAALVGKPDFSALSFTVNGSPIQYGLFFNALIAFLLIGFAVYFFVVAPMLAYQRRTAPPPAPANTKTCPECASTIPLAARRCPQCCVPLTGPAEAARDTGRVA